MVSKPYMRRLRVIPVTLTLVVMGLLLALAQVKDTVRTGPGGIRLLPGYLHETEQGIDTCPGRIWKTGGAEIGYDIGLLSGDHASALAHEPGVAWSKTQKTGKSTVMLTMTRERHLVVTINGMANFFVQNATDDALADALLMIMTYDPDKGCM